MSETTESQRPHGGLSASLYQILAIALCVLLGAAMILNNQMGGEAMWFWYARTFHHGVRLYSDLHIALQPLFILMTDAWMNLFGVRLAVTQIPSLLEILIMCAGLLLVLRESDWPDWQKGIVLLGAFTLTVTGHSYRFDDYHVLAENLLLYSFLVMLVLARTTAVRKQMLLSAVLGLFGGLMFTTRLTDGAALIAAAVLCVPFLVRGRRLASVGLLVAVAALTVVVVVQLTGDTMSAYLSSSIFRAAGSKGGTGSIFAAPFLVIWNAVPVFLMVGKRAFVGLLLIVGVGVLTARARKAGARTVFAAQMLFAAVIFLVVPILHRYLTLQGAVISTVMLLLIPVFYVLAIVVLGRFATAGGRTFALDRRDLDQHALDRREILVLLPLAEWASYSAGAAAEPLTNYYAPMVILLLLFPILQPFKRSARWVTPSYLTVMALIAVTTFTSKWIIPYQWQNYETPHMFRSRAWYDHPVYGEMYVDRELLQFSTKICSDIGARPGVNHPDLLTLPYPFPNYFCDTRPWHNYVQTFFDTSTRATIEQLMRELNTAPPQWIVYQRQLNIMKGAERLYNHGQPLAQRDLDTMIAGKIASGQWTLVDHSNYLGLENIGGGWFIIRTHP